MFRVISCRVLAIFLELLCNINNYRKYRFQVVIMAVIVRQNIYVYNMEI